MKRKSDGEAPSHNKRARVNNNNERMHDRNKYKDKPPDFLELSQKYESFAQYVKYSKKGTPTIDFTDPYAARELTKVLLDYDYGIKIDLPIDQLCPTVTSRTNYIHWLEDVLKYSEPVNENGVVRGIDIGTGASCIYPLLGVAINNWSFVATDIDDKSLELAQKNIELNQWQHKIELRKPTEDNILLTVVRDNEYYDFCMCNPPFFGSVEEKGENPQTVCTATSNELATEGGELEFVGHIIRDSLQLRHQVRWYSSMIGRKVNVAPLLKLLHDNHIHNIRQTTFYQGRTTRWAIAWSFSNDGYYQIQREARRELNTTKKSVAFILHNAQSSQVQKIIQQVLENESVPYEYNQIQSTYYIVVEGGTPLAASWNEFNGEDKNHREGQLILKMSLQIHQSQEDHVMVISKLMNGDQYLYVMFFEYLESIFDAVRDVEDE